MLKDRRSIILLNKMDIGSEVLTKETLTDLSGGQSVIEISALEKTGLNILEAGIRDLFFKNGATWNEEAQLTNSRHKEAVDRALDAMRLLETSVRDGMTEDFFAEDLMAAYANLGEIIGEQVGDDLVDNIFSKFCMGK